MDLIPIGERVRTVRKYFHLTQAEFGEKIGIAGPAVLNIELARNKGLQDNIVKLICATFNVDFHWLMTGEGNMIYESSDPVADRIDDLLESENETARAVFRVLANLDDADWKTVQKIIDTLKETEQA